MSPTILCSTLIRAAAECRRTPHLLPGERALDLQSFLSGLVQRGYSGAITVEASARSRSGEVNEGRLGEIAAILRQLSAT